MAPEEPPPQRVRVWKRHERHGPPRSLFVCIAACLALLALFPLGNRLGWFSRPREPVRPTNVPSRLAPDPTFQRPADLALSELHVIGEGAARQVEGQVHNNSDRRYEDVRVVLSVRTREDEIIGAITGSVRSIAPRSAAAFRTAIPTNAARATLSEITGTPK